MLTTHTFGSFYFARRLARIFDNTTQRGHLRRFLTQASLCSIILLLSACNAIDEEDDEDSGTGYLKIYNTSANAPGIIITLDEDLDDDDEDAYEHTYSAVDYGYATGNYAVDSNSYHLEVAWQDDDSNAREDLQLIQQDDISISSDSIKFIVVANDIQSPDISYYDIPVVDDDDDSDDELTNVRLFNAHDSLDNVSLYASRTDESFNEAILLGQLNRSQLSDNIKLDQDDYIFYITSTDTDDIIFTSDEISLNSTSQSILSIRQNYGTDENPFILDLITSSNGSQTYANEDGMSSFRIYNAIEQHDLVPDYQGMVDFSAEAVDSQLTMTGIQQGQFSSFSTTQDGDYSITLSPTHSLDPLIENHLMTLDSNTSNSIFFYLAEDGVDEDGDGNLDEDSDGIIDEIEVSIHSLVVENSQSQSIYEHQINILNFIDNEEYDWVRVYFVRNDETIDTANYSKTTYFRSPATVTLPNNTYKVYLVAEQESSQIILNSFELTLNEDSKDMFLLVEPDGDWNYKATLTSQIDD